MPLKNIFRKDSRAASAHRRVDMLNDHMLRDIGLRRVSSSADQHMTMGAPFTRYSDH